AVPPGRPVVARDFPPRRRQGRRSDDLVDQAGPLACCDAVAQRRHHALRPDRCFGHPHGPRRRASAPCVARSGTPEAACCVIPDFAPPTSSLPSLGAVLLAPFHRSPRHRYYEGSDPCRSHPEVSPLTPLCRPGIPTSTTQAARRPLCPSPQRRRSSPGFAPNEQARRSVTPDQVRHPPDRRFTSGCSTPRLTATQ